MTTNTLFTADNLDTWLAHLEQLHPNAIELGLERITTVGERLNLIEFDATVVTVAGTNGKGTTCAFLEKILVDAGYKVGVYSSPHIHRYNERLRVNFKELSDQRHCDAFAMIEKARKEVSLSYFEYATLGCLYLLQQEKCDFILLEVGLGGRLDATNMVESDVSVITTIGIDHVDWLGSDREKIGFEKAGVFRANKPAICGDLDVPDSVIEHANNISAQLKLVNKDYRYECIEQEQEQWRWIGQKTLSPIKQTLMPMQNAATALAVIEALALDINEQQLIASIEQASLAGRLQPITGYPCDVYIDVAHNPQSADYLASQLQRIKITKGEHCKVRAVVGMLSDKDMTATLSAINHEISDYRFVSLDCYRGASADLLFEAYQKSENNHHKVVKFSNVESAFEDAIKNADTSDIVIVFGSFHTVSDILKK